MEVATTEHRGAAVTGRHGKGKGDAVTQQARKEGIGKEKTNFKNNRNRKNEPVNLTINFGDQAQPKAEPAKPAIEFGATLEMPSSIYVDTVWTKPKHYMDWALYIINTVVCYKAIVNWLPQIAVKTVDMLLFRRGFISFSFQLFRLFIASSVIRNHRPILDFIVPNYKVELFLVEEDRNWLEEESSSSDSVELPMNNNSGMGQRDFIQRHPQNRGQAPVPSKLATYEYRHTPIITNRVQNWFHNGVQRLTLASPTYFQKWQLVAEDKIKFVDPETQSYKTEKVNSELFHSALSTKTINGHLPMDYMIRNIRNRFNERSDCTVAVSDLLNDNINSISSTETVIRYYAKQAHQQVLERGFYNGQSTEDISSVTGFLKSRPASGPEHQTELSQISTQKLQIKYGNVISSESLCRYHSVPTWMGSLCLILTYVILWVQLQEKLKDLQLIAHSTLEVFVPSGWA